MMLRASASALCLAMLPAVAGAEIALEMPEGAKVNGELQVENGSLGLPVAPFSDGELDVRSVDGRIIKTAWRMPINQASTADLMDFLRKQVTDAGYLPLLDCAEARCGGYDFRFQIDLLPEPDMHVDLGDFRYLSAVKYGGELPEYLQLVVSRSPNNGYVELTNVGVSADTEFSAATKTPEPDGQGPGRPQAGVADLLENGFAALGDLAFATGSADLSGDEFRSLSSLADVLNEDPDLTIALVGHTDAVGSLANNIALSKRRAQSVLDRLASEYGIARGRMEAAGVGYLAPVASNLTENGRTQNRRVEVIITSTR